MLLDLVWLQGVRLTEALDTRHILHNVAKNIINRQIWNKYLYQNYRILFGSLSMLDLLLSVSLPLIPLNPRFF